MSKYVDITLKDKTWLFPGSVETHSCTPSSRCNRCGGNGRCTVCAGKGELRCDNCGGRGEVRCSSCGGGGHCSLCHGTGLDSNGHECPSCYGGGYCNSCHGSGKVECSSCRGRGFKQCYSCLGTGNCYICGGSGEVVCERCSGTGYYQTFKEYTVCYYSRQLYYPGPTPEYSKGMNVVAGNEVFKSVCKLWKRPSVVCFDDTDRILEELRAKSGPYSEYAVRFKTEYEDAADMNSEVGGFNKYRNEIKAITIPVTKIRYEINNEEFEIVFLGNNGVVLYDRLPKKIMAFEMDTVTKTKYDHSARRRHKDIAKLTVYIFSLENIDPVESKTMSLLLKHMCLNAAQRDKYLRFLKYRYNKDVSADAMLRKMGYLFLSKKIISYVWQCIALDNQITLREQAFFDRIVERYGISKNEVESLKHFSNKFVSIDDNQFIKEYLDSAPVMPFRFASGVRDSIVFCGFALVIIGILVFLFSDEIQGRYILYTLLSGLALMFIGFVFGEPLPGDKIRKFKQVSNEQDFDFLCIQGGSIIAKVRYFCEDMLLRIIAKIGISLDKMTDKILSVHSK